MSNVVDKMTNGGLLLIIGLSLLALALLSPAFGQANAAFVAPILVGGVAAVALAVYQRWWVKNVFR